MATHRYSLADYILSVKVPAELVQSFLGGEADIDASTNTISIGGDESYTGNITITTSAQQFTTEGDVTGSWVHNQSLNKTGTVRVSIRQVSSKVRLLAKLYETYFATDTGTDGLTLTISKSTSSNPIQVALCTDCYIQGRPEIAYAETAAMQDWTFTCGRIDINGLAL